MKKAKAFDCVRLKDEIQARLMREWRGLTDEEIRERIRRRLAQSQSPIAKLWRAVAAAERKRAKGPPAGRSRRRSRRARSPA
jgi:hypothetical protein